VFQEPTPNDRLQQHLALSLTGYISLDQLMAAEEPLFAVYPEHPDLSVDLDNPMAYATAIYQVFFGEARQEHWPKMSLFLASLRRAEGKRS
jgi:hypothetical protein